MKYPDCEIHRMPQFREFPIEVLDDLFGYNPETGVLTWINPPENHPRMKDKPAGSVRNGYLLVQIGKIKIGVHRVCFAIYHRRWPHGMVDHKDRDRLNNRIANLRECSAAENCRNHGRTRNSSGLPVGVRSLPNGRFQARISFNKKQIHLGAFDSPEKASERYKQERVKLFGQFA